MKKIFFFSFFVLGIFSILAQTLIFRELVSNFYGNELFSALMLGGWLIWVGMGSLLFSKFFEKIKSWKILIFCHFFTPPLLYLLLILIRVSKINLSGMVGQIPDLLPSLIVAIFISLPLAFLLGVQFSAGAKLLKNPNQGYFWETLGFIMGGLILVLILSQTNLVIPPQELSFKNQNLIEIKNSPFLRLALTRLDSQYNFYQNSVLAFTSQKDLSLEEKSHFPLLFHFQPQKILIIGGSLLMVDEILKHRPQKIYFLEIDPELIALQKKYLSIKNEGVEILNQDPRYFLKKTAEKFDIIILNLSDPSSLLINRFYTFEFFKTLKEKLNPQGIFSLSLSFSPSFPNNELKSLNLSIFKTLRKIFKEVKIFPEDNILYLASLSSLSLEEALENFQNKDLNTRFLTKKHLEYRLKNPRNSFFVELFEKEKAQINSDFLPKSYFFTNLYWISHFQPKISGFLLNHGSKIAWFLTAMLFLALILIFFKNKKNLAGLSFYSMLIAGFSFMAFEILVIFLYQIFSGYLYYQISILIALAMLGLALGTFFGQKYQLFDFRKIHLAFALLFLTAFFFLKLGSFFLFVFLVLAGFLTGFLFPLANRIYLSQNKKVGAIYAADLIGAALGGLLFPIIFIPVLGIMYSICLLLALNLFYFIFLPHRSRQRYH